jgi:hypothetical protein
MLYNNMVNFLKKNIRSLLLAIYAFLLPSVIFAAQNPPCDPGGGKICPTINATSIPDLIQIILTGVIRIGIPVIALAIIYSGFLFVAARGNSEKLGKAKDALLYTLIGAAILLGSWAIAQLIASTVTSLGS